MDINNLKAFIAVADKRSFSRSAEVLHLTQPAVSKRIAALETELDTRLFDRVGRQVHLTEAGHVLLPSARQISSELDRIEDLIANLGREVSGKLRIVSSHYVGVYRMPAMLKRFREQFPLVELDLHFTSSATAAAGVLDGRFEMALCALHGEPTPRLKSLDVWQEELFIVVGNEHPLSKESEISIDLLMQCPAILPSTATITRAAVDSTLASINQRPAEVLETSQLETVKMMISVGLGWGCLPATMIDDSVRKIEVPELQLSRQISLVRLQERTLSRAAQAFLENLPGSVI